MEYGRNVRAGMPGRKRGGIFKLSPKILLLLVVSWAAIGFGQLALAQQTDQEKLTSLYDEFASSVRGYDGESHLGLYLQSRAPVHVVIEQAGSPIRIGATDAVEWVDVFMAGNNLTIHNMEFEQEGPVAVSFADYSGHGTGRDLFGYVKQSSGWKILLLHATPDPISGSASLSNTVDDVMNSLSSTVTLSNSLAYKRLFVSDAAPFMTINSVFSESYSSSQHSIGGYFDILNSGTGSVSLDLTNYNVRFDHSYTARVWTDYTISHSGTIVDSGRALITLYATASRGWMVSAFVGSSTLGTASEDSDEIPSSIGILQNYPNPFARTTQISYELNNSSRVNLEVYNALGQKVRTLVSDFQPSGPHSVTWDATTESGEVAAPGIYLAKFFNGEQVMTSSLILVR